MYVHENIHDFLTSAAVSELVSRFAPGERAPTPVPVG
jgi:hypothetical protein